MEKIELQDLVTREADPLDDIAFVEVELPRIPGWEQANVRKLEGMLSGFYQAATAVLARRLHSPELFYEKNLMCALDLCQKQMSRLCELKRLADIILKKMGSSRFLENYFERDCCLVFGFKVVIKERSNLGNTLLRYLRDQIMVEEDLLPDPMLNPRDGKSSYIVSSTERGHRCGLKRRSRNKDRRREREDQRLELLAA